MPGWNGTLGAPVCSLASSPAKTLPLGPRSASYVCGVVAKGVVLA